MRMIDRLFGVPKIVNSLQQEVKELRRMQFGMQINASTAIFPTYQVLENIDAYTTVDDVYAIISILAETAARIPMYGYEIVNELSMKNYKKFGQLKMQGKYYQRKAMQDLEDTDPFVEFINSITYEEKIKYYSILYITGELFLYKNVLE